MPGGAGNFQAAEYSGYSGLDTRTTFDELRRPIQIQQPDLQMLRTHYSGWSHAAIDANGHKTLFGIDGLGRTTYIQEFSGSLNGGRAVR